MAAFGSAFTRPGTGGGTAPSPGADPIEYVARVRYFGPGLVNFTVPAGVKRINIKAWGGGGSGSALGPSAQAGQRGGGGGSAGHAQASIPVVPGQVVRVSVGAGGLAVPGTGGAGNNGGDTLVSITGGWGVFAGGGSGALAENAVGGPPGVADVDALPEGSQSLLYDGVYGGSGAVGGAGASSPFGGAGAPVSPGYPGKGPGAGGAGSEGSTNSGSGGPGLVILEYLEPVA